MGRKSVQVYGLSQGRGVVWIRQRMKAGEVSRETVELAARLGESD